MKRILLIAISVISIPSCADEESKPVGPVSGSSRIPWNTPVQGQGSGQFGMLEQNRYRR